jgi:Ala-tRNA(Pro) deacylase
MTLQDYLDELGVHYHVSSHPTAYTSQDLAAAEHVKGRNVIKPVLVHADHQTFLCALPASSRVDLTRLREQLSAKEVRLADEKELLSWFPDCELGAEPPIGRLYGLPTLMDESLMQDEQVTFQAGSHNMAVTMGLADYRRAAQPALGHFVM